MITFATKTFEELSNKELYDVLQLRSEVFVVEQNCVFLDMDSLDGKAHHVLGYYQAKLVAYARLFPAGITYAEASIGRVVTRSSVRKFGFGKLLMQHSIKQVQAFYNAPVIIIGAQCYLKHFYNNLGFIEIGDVYLEDGIEHVKMRLLLNA